VLCLINPSAIQTYFAAWLKTMREAGEADVGKPVIAVDSKTPRRSHDRAEPIDSPNLA